MASILDRVPLPTRGRRNQAPEPESSPPVQTEEDFVEMTLQEHLEELRSRILKSALAVLLALVAGLWLAFPVMDKIREQAHVEGLQAISPTEPFTVYMRVALYIAIAIAMPVLVYQLMGFVSPGLTSRERRYVLIAIPFVMLSFAAGVAFAFFLLVPRALAFLSQFGGSVFEWNPRASDVLSFYMTLMLGVGLIFELPVLMYAMTMIGVVTPQRFGKFRKFAIVLSMVMAAIITPTPDPFNMMLVALPTYFLYEVGILLSRLAYRGKRAD
ncbi:MAG TPA: twin-arginine translocase subunit TatC [Thermomicrobiales bacterium]|nr:twin-arginine translocase subunit TatC [Thermomicrobiales bacterium]